MRIIQCQLGHFFDEDKYEGCPHCNPNVGIKTSPITNNAKEQLVCLVLSTNIDPKYIAILTSANNIESNSEFVEKTLFNGKICSLPEKILVQIDNSEIINLKVCVLKILNQTKISQFVSDGILLLPALIKTTQTIPLFGNRNSDSVFISHNPVFILSDQPIDYRLVKKTISIR